MAELDYAALTTSVMPSPAQEASVPDYLIAADNHNLGNSNSSWFDPSTWDPMGKTVGAGKFVAVSLASGANSFYNTGVAVSNWFGAGAEENDLALQLSELDSDLGQYYKDNKESADLVGFIATSLIPGIAGVKVFNAGQKALAASRAGMVGSNMSRATGLLVPQTDKYIKLAAADLAESSATFSAINSNTIKALGAGLGQAALESAVFETAVAATMFKSPILDDMDLGDLIKNIAIGTALGGAIGGAFTGAKTFSSIKKVRNEFDEAEKPWTHINEYTRVSNSDRIIGRFDDLDSMKKMEIPEGELRGRLERAAVNKETKLMNLAREDVHNMIKSGDGELGNMVADSLVGLDSRTVMSNLLHAEEVARVGVKTGIESKIKKALEVLDIESTKTLKVGYVKATGEGAGNIQWESPTVLKLADTVKNSDEVLKAVNKYGFKDNGLYDLYKTKSHFEAEARYIWADKFAKLKEGMSIHENDIPLLERALNDKFTSFNLVLENGSKVALNSTQDLFETLKVSKDKLAEQLVMGKRFTTEETAKVVNTRLSYVEGSESSDIASDVLARQAEAKKYTEAMIAKGRWSPEKGTIDMSTKPSYFKISYDTKRMEGIDEHLVEGMVLIKAKQKLAQQGIDNVVANHTEELYERFIPIPEEMILKANSTGAGPGFASFANGGYNTLESVAETIGSATSALIQKRSKAVADELESTLYKLANKQEAAIEFSSINRAISATTEKYVLNEAGTALVARKIKEYREAISEGAENVKPPKMQTGAAEEIPIRNAETAEAIAAHIKLQGTRTTGFKELRATQGLEDGKDVGTFYPIRPNPRDYPHFAFVVDDTVTGVGHMTMIHATSQKELEALIAKVPEPYKTITKGQSEEYHRAVGDYEFDRTLHENYIDADLKSKGINTPFFQKTDPQKIAQEFLQHHTRGEQVFSRELVNAKYEKEFSELRRLGEQYTNIASSKYGTNRAYAENVTKNPYINYVKTALDISQMSEYPLLQGFNQLVDKSFTRAYDAIAGAMSKVKDPVDLELINAELKKNGVKTAYYDSALEALSNHTAQQGKLKEFVGKANSLIATLVLRLDPLNAINNAVGANVLLGAETKSIIRAIESGNSAVAGELAALGKVRVPGTDDMILSPTKLIASSMRRFFSEEGKVLRNDYKANGWITSISDQYHSMLDDLTLRGTESAKDLDGRIRSAFTKVKSLGDVGEKFTGNKLAEEFNRFVAADVMKQISDLGVKAGVIDSSMQKAYINTFVNRTQGNMLASQRPLMFQGAVGQAVGLFQTYQFNMIQQMLRYVGEGSKKDVAALLGLQGTIYGMNGLPAFNFINQHIVGNASGNPAHRDMYNATYGVAGKEMGDWLLYGIPSNMLHTNLYTRGDINPRQVTVIPVNPKDIPIVNAAGSFFGNLKDTVSQIGQGGNTWQTILQGIEHNGLSRPLAGLAQTLQATTGNGQVLSTNRKGNIMGANDLLHLNTLARLAGGKPFDEAIVNDATYRIAAYNAVDHDRMQKLNETIKSTLIAGQEPSTEQMNSFVEKYVALGGKQKNFNRHVMSLYKSANTSQANKIAEDLKNPHAQRMQEIMGGESMMDGR